MEDIPADQVLITLLLEPREVSQNPKSTEKNSGVVRTMAAFLGQAHNEFHSYGPHEYSDLRQYKKFEVVGDATGRDQQYDLRRFLEICGPEVTELKLDLYIKDFDTYLALMLSEESPNLVKLDADLRFDEKVFEEKGTSFELFGLEHRTLTSLKIYCRGAGSYDLAKLSESGWIQLLKRYPNLKSLSLAEKRVHEGGELQPGVDGMLKSLLPLFLDGQLSLECLEMSVGEFTSPEDIAEVLTSQAATLKKLRLQGKGELPLPKFKPPELPLLESLELLGRPIQDLASLSCFQKLNSLFLTNCNVEGFLKLSDHLLEMVKFTQRDGTIVHTLSKLHCDYGGIKSLKNPLDADGVRKLARLFPNLTNLQLWLDNKTLGAVFQSWPGLQHLTIIGNRVDDNGISGVAHDLLPRMKDLKSLVMRRTALTSKSLSNFLKLPNLERLEISVHDEQLSVGQVVLRELEDKIKRVKITWK